MLQTTGNCEKFQIEDFETTASKFMRCILGLTPFEFSLSDESDLDDFSLMNSSLDTGKLSWDEFVLEKIQAEYGLTLASTRINLVALFYQIEQCTTAVVYH